MKNSNIEPEISGTAGTIVVGNVQTSEVGSPIKFAANSLPPIPDSLGMAFEKARKGLSKLPADKTVREAPDLSHYGIQREVRDYLLQRFGPYGIFAALLLSQDPFKVILLEKTALAACHPGSWCQVARKGYPRANDDKEFMQWLWDAPPFPLELPEFHFGRKQFPCLRILLPPDVVSAVKVLQAKGSPLVNVFSGLPFSDKRVPGVSWGHIVESLRSGLMQQGLDYDKVYKERHSEVTTESMAVPATAEDQLLLSNLLLRLNAAAAPIYSGTDLGRSMGVLSGGPASLPKEGLNALFKGSPCFRLKDSVLRIASSLWLEDNLRRAVTDSSTWRDISRETCLAEEAVIALAERLLMGEDAFSAINGVALDERLNLKIEDCRRAFMRTPLFELLTCASREASREIAEKWSCKDADGNELILPFGRTLTRHGLNLLKSKRVKSYELALMVPMVKHLLDQGVKVWLFMGDRVILEPGSEIHFDECSAIVSREAARLGIDIVLSQEVLGESSQKPAPPSLPGKEAA